MNLFPWTLLKATLKPLGAVLLVGCWNPIMLLSFVPKDYFFDIGFIVYVAVLDLAIECVEKRVIKSDSEIQCIWYIDELRENRHSKPVVLMDINNCHYSKIFCHIYISGNYKRLKKTEIELAVPDWFTVQPEKLDLVSRSNGKIILDLGRLLPEDSSKEKEQVDTRVRFDFLSNTSADRSIVMRPVINNVWRTDFWSNEFEVQNNGGIRCQ